MKFFVAFVAVVAVAVALPTKPTIDDAHLEAMVAAINSPNTDPATALLLQEQLAEMLDLTPISVGPAIVDLEPTPELTEIEQIVAAINSPSTDPATAVALEAMLHDLLGTSPIAVGPAIVEPIAVHPIAVGPAIVEPIGNPVDVIAVNPVGEPAAPAPVAAAASPLVQIIVNVQKAEDVATGPAVSPVLPVPAPVVEEVYVPGPVNVVDTVDITPVEPVQVVTPVIVTPVQVATPIIPEMVVNPIDTLN